jgi:hypothetical protein
VGADVSSIERPAAQFLDSGRLPAQCSKRAPRLAVRAGADPISGVDGKMPYALNRIAFRGASSLPKPKQGVRYPDRAR